jgi:ACS family D-galactonate transporter-like MFS transporter
MRTAEWRILILLVISIFINYIDRSNLSIAAPLIRHEMSLDPSQVGTLLSAFFWTYALCQLFGVAGWLVDRFDVGLVYAAGFLLWSTATAVTGMAQTFAALFILRLFLGAGESIAYPCYSKILAGNFPEHHRGIANALLDAGSKLGPALGTLLGGHLIAYAGWRPFFVVLGLGCLVWLVPWMIWRPRDTTTSIAIAKEAAPSVAEIVASRSAWGTFIGLFCANYFWFFLLTWLPSYLVDERHFSLEKMANIGSIAYFAIATATVIAGFVSDRSIASGASVTRVRKTMTVSGLMFSTIILPVAIVADQTTAIVLLFIACMAFGTFCSNHWAITQTLAGPRAAGRWTSLQNGVGNLAGITAPWLTGVSVKQTGSYYVAFVIAAVIVLIGAFMYAFVIGRVEQVQFSKARTTSP